MNVSSAENSTVVLLELVRRRQLEEDWSRRPGRGLNVPEHVAGWFESSCGGPADANGDRPFGAIVAELGDLLWAARNLSPREKAGLDRWIGLTEMPANASTVQRSFRLGRSQSAIRLRAALAAFAESVEVRPGATRTIGPVPNPATDPYLISDWEQISQYVTSLALDRIAGLTAKSYGGMYRAVLAASRSPYGFRRDGRRFPADTALSIAAWMIWRQDSQQPREAALKALEAAPLQQNEKVVSIDVAPPMVADLIRPAATQDEVTASLDWVEHGDGSAEAKRIVAALCVEAADRWWGKRAMGGKAVLCRALAVACITNRSTESWMVLRWAARLNQISPASRAARSANYAAMMVAGGHERFDLAEAFYVRAIDGLRREDLRGFAFPSTERAEATYDIRQLRFGQARRRTEFELIHGAKPHPERMLGEVRELEFLLATAQASPGAVFDGQTTSTLLAQQAYIELYRVHLASSPAEREAALRRAEQLVERAWRARGGRRPHNAAQELKVELWVRLLRGDPEAITTAEDLRSINWSRLRSGLLLSIPLGPATSHLQIVNDELLREVRDGFPDGNEFDAVRRLRQRPPDKPARRR
jgi:hypothetical protein